MRLGKAHPRASDSERGRHVSRGSHLDFGEHRPRPVPRPERRLRNDPDLLEEPTNAPQDETDPARRGRGVAGGHGKAWGGPRSGPRELTEQPRFSEEKRIALEAHGIGGGMAAGPGARQPGRQITS